MSEKIYCAAPWRGLHINFRGDVKTCCAGDPNMLGDLNHHTIHNIIQSPVMQEIRNTIKSGQLHERYCHNCIRAERYGRSERHWHNDVNQDFDVSAAAIDDYAPSIVDIRWNTTCNLSCNYCGEFCSSKWQSIKKQEPVQNGARPYYQQVCDFLEQHSKHIREVALVGGEPLLLNENRRLLDVIPQDCIVTLITNTSVDLEQNPIFQKLALRQRVGWSMSFDNTQERFEYVRHGASWQKLNHNIQLIKDLMRDQGHWGGVHAVYNLYNCTQLVEFRKWIRDQGLTVLWQTLFQPEYLDPMQHGPELKQLAIQEIDRLLDKCHSYMSPSEHDFFGFARRNLVDTMQQQSQQQLRFQEHIQQIETQYHKDKLGQFVHLWPELKFLIK
jgi:MoaA/NifB/PqqE/SkfB family radical SAM enzyme